MNRLLKALLAIVPGTILALPGAVLAISLDEAVRGREAQLFTSSVTVFTLALFVLYIVLALREKHF